MDTKKAIVISVGGMLLALVAVVVVWIQLQALWYGAETQPTTAATAVPTATSTTVSATTSAAAGESDVAAPVAASGIPVADLPISDAQRSTIESFGFDVDTMVLSQGVIDCARATLGESRYQQILAGDTPGPLETAKLLPCLNR